MTLSPAQGACKMFWLIAFAIAFGPAMIAQLRGHYAAGAIILLDLGALVLVAVSMYYAHSGSDGGGLGPAPPLLAAVSWLGAFLWSLGK
jgi:hypothetical protein